MTDNPEPAPMTVKETYVMGRVAKWQARRLRS